MRLPSLLRYGCIFVRDSEAITWVSARGYGTQPFEEISNSADGHEDLSKSLMLFDEEAFYLVSINELEVVKDSSSVDKHQLWKYFVTKNAKFPINFCVYANFKSKTLSLKLGLISESILSYIGH